MMDKNHKSKNEMQVEFGQEFNSVQNQNTDNGSLSAREAGTVTKKLVALGEEMLVDNSNASKTK